MMKYTSIILTAVLLSACGGNDLEEKKAKLSELKGDVKAMVKEIETLEQEIARLDTTTSVRKTKYVKVTSFKPKTFRHYIDVQGSVESDRTININPKMNGIVVKSYVKAGQKVSKNQLLAQIDPSIILLAIDELKTGLETATIMYNKQKSLWDENIGTEVQYIQAKAKKESLEKKLASLEEQLDMTKIKATIAGTVDMINLKEGEVVSPGFPVFKIVNLGDLKIVADISDAHISKIKKGDSVAVFFSDINYELMTTIDVVSKVIDNTNRTFSIELKLPDTKGKLSPNMICSLSINDKVVKNTFTLPIGMVQQSDENEFVFVAISDEENWMAKKQQIETGLKYNGSAQIVSGINEGHKVITVGYQDLTDNELININN